MPRSSEHIMHFDGRGNVLKPSFVKDWYIVRCVHAMDLRRELFNLMKYPSAPATLALEGRAGSRIIGDESMSES